MNVKLQMKLSNDKVFSNFCLTWDAVEIKHFNFKHVDNKRESRRGRVAFKRAKLTLLYQELMMQNIVFLINEYLAYYI